MDDDVGGLAGDKARTGKRFEPAREGARQVVRRPEDQDLEGWVVHGPIRVFGLAGRMARQ
jgi:hypothetical protein